MILINKQIKSKHYSSIFIEPQKRKKKRNLSQFSLLDNSNIVKNINIFLNHKQKQKRKLKLDLAKFSNKIKHIIKQNHLQPSTQVRCKSQVKSNNQVVMGGWKQKYHNGKSSIIMQHHQTKQQKKNINTIPHTIQNQRKQSKEKINKNIQVIAMKKAITQKTQKQKTQRVKTQSYLLKQITLFTGRQLEQRIQKGRGKLQINARKRNKKKLKLKLPTSQKNQIDFLQQTNKLLKIDPWDQNKIQQSLQL